MPITIGTKVCCAISPLADTDLFRFEGVTDDTVMVTLTDTQSGSGHPLAIIFNPNQVPIDTLGVNDTGVREIYDLQKTGQYTILVRENGNDQTATYCLALQGIFPAPLEAVSACADSSHQDAIDVLTDSDVFLFDGVASDRVMLTLTDRTSGSGHPIAEVFAPSGNSIDTLSLNDGGLRAIYDLSASGTYTVLLRENGDNQTATYNLAWQTIFPPPPAAVSIPPDSAHTNQIGVLADSDVFLFDGLENARMALTLSDHTSGSGHPIAEIFDPNRNPIDTLFINDTGVRALYDLPTAGQYTVLVRENGDNQTATYTLALQSVFPAPQSATCLNYGEVVQGAIGPIADSDVFFLPVDGTTTIELTLTDTTSGSGFPVIEVIDKERAVIATFGTNDAASTWSSQPQSEAVYKLLVHENGDDQLATFNLGVQCVFGQCPSCEFVGVADEHSAAAPAAIALMPVFPNPALEGSRLRFSLPGREIVNIDVYDLNGRLVRRLLRQEMASGQHSVSWDGRTDAGLEVGSGVYLYSLRAGERRIVTKGVLVR